MLDHENPQPARLFDYPAAQVYLGGISRSFLKALVAAGELRGHKLGRRTMFDREDLDAYITRCKQGRS